MDRDRFRRRQQKVVSIQICFPRVAAGSGDRPIRIRVEQDSCIGGRFERPINESGYEFGCRLARLGLVSVLARHDEYPHGRARISAIANRQRPPLRRVSQSVTALGRRKHICRTWHPGWFACGTGCQWWAAFSSTDSSALFTVFSTVFSTMIRANRFALPRDETTTIGLRSVNSRTKSGELVINPEAAQTSWPSFRRYSVANRSELEHAPATTTPLTRRLISSDSSNSRVSGCRKPSAISIIAISSYSTACAKLCASPSLSN